MIHQELVLVPYMTVAEKYGWGGRKILVQRISPALKAVEGRKRTDGRLGDTLDADAVANRLGVAEMQLVELVRAISYDSDIIIMDERHPLLQTRR
jgi:ABC-type sugar transport system ATPase subunit